MLRKIFLLVIIYILAMPFVGNAQRRRSSAAGTTSVREEERIPRGKAEAMYNVIPGNYNFWIYTPADYEPMGHRFPLIIFLHGKSLSGYNLNRVKQYGVIDAINKGKIVPALVLAPQTHNGWNPDKVNELLEWAKKNYMVDTTRVYVIGMSMGGYGTMDFCNKYPKKVAAAMAFCGGCTDKEPSGLSKVPLWIMHGTADRAVPLSCSKRVVDYLQNNCSTRLLRYDWMQGGTHGIYARCFYMQKVYDWLFSHCTKDKPRMVDRSFDITKEDFHQTYQELKWFKGMFEND